MQWFRRSVLSAPLIGLSAVLLGLPSAALGDDNDRGNFHARLSGFQENPAIFTAGEGTARFKFGRDNIEFELRYTNLTGAPNVAHLHLGGPGVNGGVFVFLCGGGGKPACPASNSGSVSGTIVAGDLQAIAAQGFPAGNLDAAKRAIRAGAVYANMHTAMFPAGEIRGQLERGG
jgi:hypothetical protein